MLGKMASYQEEYLLRSIIKQARVVRDGYTFKFTNVLDENDRCVPLNNRAELIQLDRLFFALDALYAEEEG